MSQSAPDDSGALQQSMSAQSEDEPTTDATMDIPMTDAPPADTEPLPAEMEASTEPTEPAITALVAEAPLISEDPPSSSPAPETTNLENAEISPSEDTTSTPPPPPPDPLPETPEWVQFEEDQSKPTPEEEEELKLRESKGTELSALDVPAVEKRIYSDVDDPEMRPIKKLRLSWVIKGVRGTKEKPNHARVMISPPAYVDGRYWQIKFYPRGNRSSSYSAYVRCTKKKPSTDRGAPDSVFSYFEGPADANLGSEAVPVCTIKTEPPVAKEATSQSNSDTETQKQETTDSPQDPGAESSEPTSDSATPEGASAQTPLEEDWRVSCQLGVVLFNPDEPRTCAFISSEHQFSKHSDDWGWSNVVGPWKDAHLRQHLQRAPLLQNDTIAVDAHIRIFDDPTKALWWKSSDSEPRWDSKSLAGYFPMGTPGLYHSPAVAGMTAWLLLAPFRKLIQEVDAGRWRHEPQVRPKPLIAQLQVALFLMRRLNKPSEPYVDLYPVIQALNEVSEVFTDVSTFWEVFRRAVEIELEEDEVQLARLKAIFDTPTGPISLPVLLVENVLDLQQTLSNVLRKQNFKGALPDFLPLTLDRDRFDKTRREWNILHDKVTLNDELDLSEFINEDEHSKYTLYGAMVHEGDRESGRFYSILRPHGPGTMWLGFEDGDGNQVFSYSRNKLRHLEGLEGQALKDLTDKRRPIIYMAMYIKTSRLSEYLSALEPFSLPAWLMNAIGDPYVENEDNFIADPPQEPAVVKVEAYLDSSLNGREGLLDMYNIKGDHPEHTLELPMTMTFQDLRSKLAQKMNVAPSHALRLFIMNYSHAGAYSTAQLARPGLDETLGSGLPIDRTLCLWMSVLKGEEIDLFGAPDDEPVPEKITMEATASPSADVVDNSQEPQAAAQDLEQASVTEAVLGDVVRAEASAVAVEVTDVDTPMQMEAATTSDENLSAEVPHGHLIDAAAHLEPTELGSAEVAVLNAVIAQDPNAMDFETNLTNTDSGTSQSGGTPSQTSAPEPEDPYVDNGYGFIQRLDVDNQTFRVQEAFFAKFTDKVREFLLKRLGYDSESNVVIWRRFSAADGAVVNPDETFKDIRFVNGSDFVVYEALPEDKTTELEKQGKFTTPGALSKYLRMVERRHPILSRTTTEPVEIYSFGTDYHHAPLLNGRFHGPACTHITSAGHTYNGPLVSGIRSGRSGQITYSNGDTYTGDWSHDERHGQGTFIEARTGNKYVGGFENGKRWGMGTTYWKVADEQADMCQICCENEIDSLFFDCGHVCACLECSRQCEICPICRRVVKQVVKMFRA
jgi:hypothetical protein